MREQEDKPRKRGRPKKQVERSEPVEIQGVPLDEVTGLPIDEEIEIDRRVAMNIPLDSESARVMRDYKDVLRRKNRGELGVKWNASERLRYQQVSELHPNSMVSFRQVAPFVADNVPSSPVRFLDSYDKLIQHLEENHWNGERASYEWIVGDAMMRQRATGIVHLGENMAKKQPSQQQQPGPQQGYVPPGYPPMPPQYGYPGHQMPPPYGYPPPNPYYPPPAPHEYQPQLQPQVATPPAAPPPQPAPPGTDPRDWMVSQLFTEVRRMQELMMQMQRQPPPAPYPYPYIHPYPQQHQEVQAPPASPPVPPTPIESAKQAVDTIVELNKLNKSITQTLAGPESEVSSLPGPKDDEDFPLKVKDFGIFRMTAADEDGDGRLKVQTGFGPFLLANGDKIAGGLKALMSEIRGAVGDHAKQQESSSRLQDEQRSKALEDAEKLTLLKERMARASALELEVERQKQMQKAPPPPPAPEMTWTAPVPPNGAAAIPVDEVKEPAAPIEETPV